MWSTRLKNEMLKREFSNQVFIERTILSGEYKYISHGPSPWETQRRGRHKTWAQIIRQGRRGRRERKYWVRSKNGIMRKVTFKITRCPPNSTSFKIPNCVCVCTCVCVCVCWEEGVNTFGWFELSLAIHPVRYSKREIMWIKAVFLCHLGNLFHPAATYNSRRFGL